MAAYQRRFESFVGLVEQLWLTFKIGRETPHLEREKPPRNSSTAQDRALEWLANHKIDNLDLCLPWKSPTRASFTCTPLFLACSCGELEVCEWLFDNGAAKTLHRRDSRGCCVFHATSFYGHLDVSRWLISVGAGKDISARDNHGKTPLFTACMCGHLALAKYLLEAGAANDVKIADVHGNTPLYVACKHGRFDIVVWLCKIGAYDDILICNDAGRSPLYIACFKGHLEVAKWLIDKGAVASIRNKVSTGETPMWVACSNGHLALAEWLFEVGAAEDVRTKNNASLTPFSAACRNGHIKVVKWLFKMGAAGDIQNKDKARKRPLFLSCTKATVSGALPSWLLLNGAANDAMIPDNDGHIDAGILNDDIQNHEYRAAVMRTLLDLISEHTIFTEYFLLCVHESAKDVLKYPLGNLHGHEISILQHIADYVGVIRGRQLRNAKESVRVMARPLSN